MKKLKVCIDISMLIFLILSLFNWHFIVFHIVTGSLFAILIGIHTCLNFKWITGVTKTIKKRTAKVKIKLQYAINIILLIVWFLLTATGIIAAAGIGFAEEVHVVSAIIACVLTVTHIVQHRRRLVSLFKRKRKSGNNQAV